MSKIIGICNQKGGTGKTTTAINLSSYLGLAGKETLLVDIDPQGNATSGIGIDTSNNSFFSIYSLLMDETHFEQVIISTNWPHLSLIPSEISLTGAEIELVNITEREKKLKYVIDELKEQYAYIIIDAPPSLGLLTINVLCAVDSVIIPIQCEYYALEGMSKLLNTIKLVRERLNSNLEIEGILLTMADFRTRLTLQVIDEVKNFFKNKTFNTIIPRNIRLAEAPSFGKPIFFYDPFCVGAKAYMNLAEEILKEKIEILLPLQGVHS
ncbi:MAG: AAA family ATPase [Candidatus Omnitrophica bacterium]|nr:AAA family ATPase [Candidatus Omnitrophota bacterium]MCM8825915.1 AAA family ATPase [Candidatus Omnitrophota bacterium]